MCVYVHANISWSFSIVGMNHSVELCLVLLTFVVSFFWSNKFKSADVGALIVLPNSVEVIFLCLWQPATPNTRVRFHFFKFKLLALAFL